MQYPKTVVWPGGSIGILFFLFAFIFMPIYLQWQPQAPGGENAQQVMPDYMIQVFQKTEKGPVVLLKSQPNLITHTIKDGDKRDEYTLSMQVRQNIDNKISSELVIRHRYSKVADSNAGAILQGKVPEIERQVCSVNPSSGCAFHNNRLEAKFYEIKQNAFKSWGALIAGPVWLILVFAAFKYINYRSSGYINYQSTKYLFDLYLFSALGMLLWFRLYFAQTVLQFQVAPAHFSIFALLSAGFIPPLILLYSMPKKQLRNLLKNWPTRIMLLLAIVGPAVYVFIDVFWINFIFSKSLHRVLFLENIREASDFFAAIYNSSGFTNSLKILHFKTFLIEFFFQFVLCVLIIYRILSSVNTDSKKSDKLFLKIPVYCQLMLCLLGLSIIVFFINIFGGNAAERGKPFEVWLLLLLPVSMYGLLKALSYLLKTVSVAINGETKAATENSSKGGAGIKTWLLIQGSLVASIRDNWVASGFWLICFLWALWAFFLGFPDFGIIVVFCAATSAMLIGLLCHFTNLQRTEHDENIYQKKYNNPRLIRIFKVALCAGMVILLTAVVFKWNISRTGVLKVALCAGMVILLTAVVFKWNISRTGVLKVALCVGMVILLSVVIFKWSINRTVYNSIVESKQDEYVIQMEPSSLVRLRVLDMDSLCDLPAGDLTAEQIVATDECFKKSLSNSGNNKSMRIYGWLIGQPLDYVLSQKNIGRLQDIERLKTYLIPQSIFGDGYMLSPRYMGNTINGLYYEHVAGASLIKPFGLPGAILLVLLWVHLFICIPVGQLAARCFVGTLCIISGYILLQNLSILPFAGNNLPMMVVSSFTRDSLPVLGGLILYIVFAYRQAAEEP